MSVLDILEQGNGLYGTWVVYCQNPKHFEISKNPNQQDTVKGVTKNHYCKHCGYQSVVDGVAMVVCQANHHDPGNIVSGITRKHTCVVPGCGRECEGWAEGLPDL